MLSKYLGNYYGPVMAIAGIILLFCLFVFMPMFFTYMSSGEVRP